MREIDVLLRGLKKYGNAGRDCAISAEDALTLAAALEAAQEERDALRKALGRILENEASDWKAAEEFGGYVLDDELREEARAALEQEASRGGWQSLTDEHKAILNECRNQAMRWTLVARIPECGIFGGIAQDLDYLCEQLGVKDE